MIDAPKLLQRQQRHLSAFEHLLPEFVALSDKYENKPSVEYFEGVAGLKRLYEDTLTSSTPLKAFMGKQTTVDDDMLAYLYDEYMPQRVAAGIQAYVIVCDAAENQAYCDADDQQWLKETLMISHAVFSLANEINLYNGNKVSVALYTADELSGILITSNHLYDTLVSIFDLLRVSFHDPK